jgi:polysaccharide biosynthesis transport protein
VIIDTPAALGLADATILARVVDGIVMVVGAGIVSRRDAVRAKEILATAHAPILGVVLNRTDVVPGALTYAYYHARQADIPPSPESLTRRQPARGRWLGRVADLIVPRKRG